ncbi:nibrin [Trichonephila clavipes]|uniref:Nibrin n=1 Tax=Trichonephila clavipes TaxID=2585209 RepID=A0A8X6VI01_TRICX|nr:nibrin [Trichonephila clavipes]
MDDIIKMGRTILLKNSGPKEEMPCLLRFDWSQPIDAERWLAWGGIILGSRTDPHVQSVTMKGHIYRDVILEQHVCLFRGAMGAEFLFMDDNARRRMPSIGGYHPYGLASILTGLE